MPQDFHCWAPFSRSPLPHHPVPLISVPSLIPTSSAPGRADLQQKIPHSGQNQLNLQQFVAGLCWDLSLKLSRGWGLQPRAIWAEISPLLRRRRFVWGVITAQSGPPATAAPLGPWGLAPGERPNTQPPGLAALAAGAEPQLIICW